MPISVDQLELLHMLTCHKHTFGRCALMLTCVTPEAVQAPRPAILRLCVRSGSASGSGCDLRGFLHAAIVKQSVDIPCGSGRLPAVLASVTLPTCI